MLTPQQIAQANATARPVGSNVAPTQQMTPEEAHAWITGGAPAPSSGHAPATDVGIGAVKGATAFGQGADLMGTMQRLGQGDSSDLNKGKLAAIPKSMDVLGTMHEIGGGSSDWTSQGQPQQTPSQTPDWTGQTPEQRQEALQPTNEAQKVGQVAVNTAVNLLPFAGEVGGLAKTAMENLKPKPGEMAARTAGTQDADIVHAYTKAIKPTIVSKTNPGQYEKYNAHVVNAVSKIIENKNNLELVDQFGDPGGRLPESIDQFRQAIEQTKANIFKKYDTMAQSAGDKGAVVDLKPIAGELQKVATNKIVQDLHPDLASYADSRASTLLNRAEYSTTDAQAAVQNLNRSLDAFYRNPSYETASKASVDSLIANLLRSGLDKSIEQAGSEGYQGLKNDYASLKAIEKDVIKRNIVEARQTGGRGMNVGDIVSAEELIRGLATHNPAAMVTAGAIKGIQALRKYLTDPNRGVRLMFEKAAQNQSSDNPISSGNLASPNDSTPGESVKYPVIK